MSRKKKWLILAIILAVSSYFAILKGLASLEELKEALPERLGSEIGLPVAVGKIELDALDSVAVKDILISDEGGKILSAPSITIEVSFLQALKGKSPLACVKQIRIRDAQLFLRQLPDGSWNVEKLRKQESASQNEFSGVVSLEKIEVQLEKQNQVHKLSDLSGTLECEKLPELKVSLKALLDGSEAELTGRYQTEGRSELKFSIRSFNLERALIWLPKNFEGVSSLGGELEQLEFNANKEKGQWTFAAETQLKNGRLHYQNWDFNDADAGIIFTEHSAYAVGSLKIMEQAVRFNLQGDWSGGLLSCKGDLSGKKIDLAKILPQTELSGQADFELKIGGNIKDPEIAGRVTLPEGSWRDFSLRDAKVEGRFSAGSLEIKNASLGVCGGAIKGVGRIELAAKRYALQLEGENLSLERFAPSIEGQWNGSVLLEGQNFAAAPAFKGTARMSAGLLQGFTVDAAEMAFHGDADKITFDAINIKAGAGEVSANGTVNERKLDFSVAASRLPMTRITSQISGEGSFSGSLRGDLSVWQLSGEAALHDGKAFEQPYNTAQGILELDSKSIRLKAWDLQQQKTKHKVEGYLGYNADAPLELKITTLRARAEDVVQLLLPGEELTGNIDNELTLSGSLQNLKANGSLKLSDGSFRGRLIARAEGEYQLNGDELYLKKMTIDSLNTAIEVSGKAARGDGLDLKILANNIDFARLPFAYPYPVTGSGKFNGRLTGSVAEPVLSGEFQAERLHLDKEVLSKISANLKFAGQELEISDAAFKHGDGEGRFRGGFDFANHNIYGLLQAKNLTIERVMPIFQMADHGLHGSLFGELRLEGKAARPDAWLNGYLTGGSIKNYPLDRVELDLALEKNILQINQFKAQQGKGSLLAKGVVDLDGKVDLEVGGQDIDAGIITALSGCDWDLKGKLRFAAQVGGTAKEPQAAASIEINDGGVKTATFDSLYGLFILEKNNIQVNQILLRKDKYRASAYGNIPLAALTAEGRGFGNEKSEMELRCRLDNANLSILPLLAPQLIEWGEGETQGELNIGGTLQAPDFKGHLAIKNGRLKLQGIKDPLENIAVDASMAGDTLSFKQFSAKLGKGQVALNGTMRLADWKWRDYDLALKLDSPEIRHRYFSGPVRGDLALRPDPQGRPLLSGDVILENDMITIPVVPEFSGGNMDFALDLNLTVGNKVRAYNPILYDFLARGRLHFGGTTKEPVSSGKIRVVNGNITYLSTTFKIIDGIADFNRPLFEPVIKVFAQAHLPQLSVNLTINGPVREMEMTLTSDPPMNQAQILAVLNAGGSLDSRERGGFDEVAGLLNAGLHARFFGQFEGNIRNAFGLDQFRIIKGAKGEVLRKTYWEKEGAMNNNREVYNLQMGKYLNDKVYVGYNVALGYQAYEATLRYDLSRRISIIAATDDQNRKWFGMEARFKF